MFLKELVLRKRFKTDVNGETEIELRYDIHLHDDIPRIIEDGIHKIERALGLYETKFQSEGGEDRFGHPIGEMKE